MSSRQPHITANVEIRSISDEDDDDESSISSFPSTTRQGPVATLHDEDLMERNDLDQVTTEEMIAEAIREAPNFNDVSMEGCTNITIGNQTHIKGTVIIRNVLTRSIAEPPDVKPRISNSVNRNDVDSIRQSSSSEVSKVEEDFEFHRFRKSKKNGKDSFQQMYSTRKRKFIILSVLIVILLIVSGIFAAILLYSSSGDSDGPIVTTTEGTTEGSSTTSIVATPTSTSSTTASSSSSLSPSTPSSSSSTPTSTSSTTTSSSSSVSPSTPSSSSSTSPTTTPFPLTIVGRREWHQMPSYTTVEMKHPIEEIFVCHTGKLFDREFPRGCFTKEECTNFAVKMEEHYIKKLTWVDLPYNFFLGNDRLLYEGRGWLFDGAFKSIMTGDSCLSIGFIGDYSNFKPADTQLEILFALIDLGIELGHISVNYKIFGECQGKGTQSPGKQLFEITKSWDHWSNYSDVHIMRECKFD